MSLRTWLYGKLTDPADTELQALIGTRVFAKKSMRSSVEEHPYLIYKMGNDTTLDFSEEFAPHTQFFHIFVEDYADVETADYMKIDSIIRLLKSRLDQAVAPSEGVIRINYLETSQDLDDNTLQTVFKYIRFSAIVGS